MHRNRPRIILDYRRVISIFCFVVQMLALRLRSVDLAGTTLGRAIATLRPMGETRVSLFKPHLPPILFPLNMKSIMDTLNREIMPSHGHMIRLRFAGDLDHPLHLRIRPQVCMPLVTLARRFPQRCLLRRLRTRQLE